MNDAQESYERAHAQHREAHGTHGSERDSGPVPDLAVTDPVELRRYASFERMCAVQADNAHTALSHHTVADTLERYASERVLLEEFLGWYREAEARAAAHPLVWHRPPNDLRARVAELVRDVSPGDLPCPCGWCVSTRKSEAVHP